MRLHKSLPLPKNYLRYIVSDIRFLYPESDSIAIVGTYARLNEEPALKKHDLDILIHFPSTVNQKMIEHRNDDFLWVKWSEKNFGILIDFLLMFGQKQPKYGKHLWRKQKKLKTPKIIIWKKPTHKKRETRTTAYGKGRLR